MTKVEQLERLATRVELELRAAKREAKERTRRSRGRPARVRTDADHGTEQDYQAEHYAHRFKGGPAPCEVCKRAHAMHERRRRQERA